MSSASAVLPSRARACISSRCAVSRYGSRRVSSRPALHSQLRAPLCLIPSPALRVRLERAQVQVLEPPPRVVDPRRLFAGEQRPSADEHRDLRRPPRTVKVALGDRRFRSVHSVCGRLDVDPCRGRQCQPKSGKRHDAPELREQGREAAVASVGPERIEQLVTRERPIRLKRVREQPPLTARHRSSTRSPSSSIRSLPHSCTFVRANARPT
jgi:hypothetical protein